MKAVDRLYDYLNVKGLKPTAVEKAIGLYNGYLSAQRKRQADIGEGMMNKIIDYCRDINPEWLLTGKGKMFREIYVDVTPSPSNNSVSTDSSMALLSLIREKDITIREQAEEIGRLKERIKQLERAKNNTASDAIDSMVANAG